jgi:hypothetical protein
MRFARAPARASIAIRASWPDSGIPGVLETARARIVIGIEVASGGDAPEGSVWNLMDIFFLFRDTRAALETLTSRGALRRVE